MPTSLHSERTLYDDTTITIICPASARILRSGISSDTVSIEEGSFYQDPICISPHVIYTPGCDNKTNNIKQKLRTSCREGHMYFRNICIF